MSAAMETTEEKQGRKREERDIMTRRSLITLATHSHARDDATPVTSTTFPCFSTTCNIRKNEVKDAANRDECDYNVHNLNLVLAPPAYFGYLLIRLLLYRAG